jgi:hypothetical protein
MAIRSGGAKLPLLTETRSRDVVESYGNPVKITISKGKIAIDRDSRLAFTPRRKQAWVVKHGTAWFSGEFFGIGGRFAGVLSHSYRSSARRSPCRQSAVSTRSGARRDGSGGGGRARAHPTTSRETNAQHRCSIPAPAITRKGEGKTAATCHHAFHPMARAATKQRPMVMAASAPRPTGSPSKRRHLHAELLALARHRKHDHAILPGVPFH